MKISDLPEDTDPSDASELAIVEDGVTKRVSRANFVGVGAWTEFPDAVVLDTTNTDFELGVGGTVEAWFLRTSKDSLELVYDVTFGTGSPSLGTGSLLLPLPVVNAFAQQVDRDALCTDSIDMLAIFKVTTQSGIPIFAPPASTGYTIRPRVVDLTAAAVAAGSGTAPTMASGQRMRLRVLAVPVEALEA